MIRLAEVSVAECLRRYRPLEAPFERRSGGRDRLVTGAEALGCYVLPGGVSDPTVAFDEARAAERLRRHPPPTISATGNC